MKTLFLLLFLAGASVALADDANLLKNGDFSSGIAEWHGDCHSIGSATDDTGATSGIIVKLRSHDWTKVTQDFDGKAGNYLLTVIYTLGAGTTFSQKPEDYSNVSGGLGLGGMSPFASTPSKWVVLISDTGTRHVSGWKVTPRLDTSGTQTLKADVWLNSGDSFRKGFFLGFPPGEGSINLQSITLASANTASASP
jgi:hypothetical protein